MLLLTRSPHQVIRKQPQSTSNPCLQQHTAACNTDIRYTVFDSCLNPGPPTSRSAAPAGLVVHHQEAAHPDTLALDVNSCRSSTHVLYMRSVVLAGSKTQGIPNYLEQLLAVDCLTALMLAPV
jgi:hypothetical protein